MTSSLNSLGAFVTTIISQVAAPPPNPWDTADSTQNVMFYPEAIQPTTNGGLAHLTGGLENDKTLQPRVSAIIGPGATLRGLATSLLGLFTAAAPPAAPTVDELARALVVYNQHYLPAATMENYRVGLRIPLPIERDAANSRWVLNSAQIRTWSAAFDATWAPLLDRRPGLLQLMDDADRKTDAAAFLRDNANTEDLAAALYGRLIRNPYEVVLPAFELFRQMGADAFGVALALMDFVVVHQLELLATLTGGSGFLQRLAQIFNSAPTALPAEVQQQLTRASTLLAQALRPGGVPVAPREVPETTQQLNDRGVIGEIAQVRAAELAGGRHRMVLGRDVLAGRMDVYGNYRGPAYGGRLDTAAFIAANSAALNPDGDVQIDARLDIIASIARNEGYLDGVRLRDAGLVSSGLHQWTLHVNNELLPMLLSFKEQSPDDFMLFLRLYGLEVRDEPGNATGDAQAILQEVRANGAVHDLIPVLNRSAFFGSFVNMDGRTEFPTLWAARFRMASLASVPYKAAQCRMALARFDRIIRQVGNLAVNGINRAVNEVFTSEHGVALILDHHINAPGNVRGDLRAAINHAQGLDLVFTVEPDAFEQAAINHYQSNRNMVDSITRANRIAAVGLPRTHGSFTGW
ncbi:hypothetical protein KRR26_36205 [Corallococcus sp. M34]|uniref:hypothetical protein n=1 Tax=Citreicoccus inhibens TaxID=2849499 RepID=UPI001C20FEDF|nr:hypothetical protein [Citreicoccus inhibens]MBU8901043.1 hypothetical protein [Citreicoccus inhibens]